MNWMIDVYYRDDIEKQWLMFGWPEWCVVIEEEFDE